MDRIVVPDIPLQARVGVPEAERMEPQEVFLGLVLWLSLAEAAASDDLTMTVDYDAVCARVADVVTARPYRLVEAMAGAVAGAILEDFPVDEVEVRVRKPGALRARGVPYAAVEIRRRRDG